MQEETGLEITIPGVRFDLHRQPEVALLLLLCFRARKRHATMRPQWRSAARKKSRDRLLTLVKPATHPDGSHPLAALRLVSYSGASAVTVVKAPASTEAEAANDGRPARVAARASVLMFDFTS